MNPAKPTAEYDLVVLVADKDCKFALDAFLRRTRELRVRPIHAHSLVHPNRDPGVRTTSAALLRPFLKRAHYALAVLDHEGSGQEHAAPELLEEDIIRQMTVNGWENRCDAVVLSPELEICLWDGTGRISRVLHWPHEQSPHDWLLSKGFLEAPGHKPDRPKEAFASLLREADIQRSSALYGQLAADLAFLPCPDRAVARLVSRLQTWFSP